LLATGVADARHASARSASSSPHGCAHRRGEHRRSTARLPVVLRPRRTDRRDRKPRPRYAQIGV